MGVIVLKMVLKIMPVMEVVKESLKDSSCGENKIGHITNQTDSKILRY